MSSILMVVLSMDLILHVETAIKLGRTGAWVAKTTNLILMILAACFIMLVVVLAMTATLVGMLVEKELLRHAAADSYPYR